MDPMIPPAGGDQNFGPVTSALSLITGILAFICVCIRTYIRLFATHGFGWDDAMIIFSMLATIPGIVFNALMVVNGAGRHTFYLSHSQISHFVKWNTAYQLDNIISITLTKISIILFILRIQRKGYIAWVAYIVMGLTLVVNIASEAMPANQCRPLAGLWDREILAKCESLYFIEVMVILKEVSVAGVCDLLCSLSPIVILWNVEIKKLKKIAICALMSLGLIATAANLTKIAQIHILRRPDITWNALTIHIAAVLEAHLGITAACLPTLQSFFKKAGAWIRIQLNIFYGFRDRLISGQKRGDESLPGNSRNYQAIIKGDEKSQSDSNVPLQELKGGNLSDGGNGSGREILYKQNFELRVEEKVKKGGNDMEIEDWDATT